MNTSGDIVAEKASGENTQNIDLGLFDVNGMTGEEIENIVSRNMTIAIIILISILFLLFFIIYLLFKSKWNKIAKYIVIIIFVILLLTVLLALGVAIGYWEDIRTIYKFYYVFK